MSEFKSRLKPVESKSEMRKKLKQTGGDAQLVKQLYKRDDL